MRSLKARDTIRRARRPAAWRPILPAGLVLLAACAASPTTSRVYPGLDPNALHQRTVAAFRASHLEVTANDSATGVITGVGSFDDRNWAECAKPRMLVQDTKGRHRLVDAPEKEREVELQASVSDGPQGATLTLDPAFTLSPGHRMATSPKCETTGALEREILDAVAQP
jgi:hypothetical protein